MFTNPTITRAIQLGVLFFILLLSLPATSQKLEGIATFYADRFDGKLTSTGEIFRQSGYSAASKDLPWGTIVEVTNVANGRKTQVRINDCGPHKKGRIIDLSKTAARDLDFLKTGEAKVILRIVRTSVSGPTCSRGDWAKKLRAAGKAIPPPPGTWTPSETGDADNTTVPPPPGTVEGMASYYADRLDGRPTSTGELYDLTKFTAASKIYPYNTVLEVTNIVSGAKTQVRVNDCGPHHPDRMLDLSRAAARQAEILQAGVARVHVRVISLGKDGPTCDRSQWAKAQRDAAGQQASNSTAMSPGQAPPPTPTVTGTGPAPSTYATPQAAAPIPEAAATPEIATTEVYGVQIAAFGSEPNADKAVANLKEKGFKDAYFIREGKLIRVFVGKAPTAKDAEPTKQQLAKAGYSKVTVKAVQVAEEDAKPVVYGPPQATAPTFDPTDILFGVQVAAFKAKSSAEKMVKELEDKGFPEVQSVTVGKVTRVFAGKYYFQNQAEGLKDKLAEAGYPATSVRRIQ